jgi:hypothetical protein
MISGNVGYRSCFEYFDLCTLIYTRYHWLFPSSFIWDNVPISFDLVLLDLSY